MSFPEGASILTSLESRCDFPQNIWVYCMRDSPGCAKKTLIGGNFGTLLAMLMLFFSSSELHSVSLVWHFVPCEGQLMHSKLSEVLITVD